MSTRQFIHLHNHTEYSLLDGAATVNNLVAKAKEMGATAVAMTDHGNMYAAIKFYNQCIKQNIKPIIGCELYVVDDMHKKMGRINDEGNKPYHLVLIAKNENGFKNLSRLSSLGFTEGFYFRPRIDLELLSKYSDDLICLSACLGGALPRLLLNNDYQGAKEYALKLKSLFAEGDFYIELQDHGLIEQKQTNPLLAQIAKEIGVKCVATNDVHYINKSDAEAHDVLLCIQTASFIDETDRMKFPCDEFYLKDYQQMQEALGWHEEALQTPFEIVDKCDISFEFNKYQLPKYQCPNGYSPEEYLRKLTYDGLIKRYGKITDELKERADSELEVIISMGFSEYYLIVWDFIAYAKKQDIPVGPGRGSGVGSIVAYAIEITNVDPIKYSLIFERFLNKDRTSMPDFDIDFCYNRRGEVIQYVKDTYGDDYISQIITFGKLKKKAAIKDVARVFRLPFADVTKLTKSIGDFGKSLADHINPESVHAIPELIEQYNNFPEYKRVIDIAIQIEGMPRNTSIHAAGVVIYKNPALDTIPLAKNGDEVTTQFDMQEVEKLGLLKMDFLALMTLTDIKMSHDYVLKNKGIDIDFDKIGYDDPQVFELIAAGNTDAVFQLESGGMKNFMTRFKPTCMEDIIAGISLYRPGPMSNIDMFIDNNKNPEKIKYKHPLLEPILNVTNGIIVYQEQAMMITRVLAGYDMTRADNFRAIISKKKIDQIPIEKKVFVHGLKDKDGNTIIPGCVGNNISAEVGESIFLEMQNFASYAFNKSHAAAYAVLSYETAFYKRYYPVEFMAAVINNRINKPDDTAKYMRVLQDINIPLLPPDINKSSSFFAPDNGSIRYGLSCIKNVGMAAMDIIIDERNKHGEFKDLYDFIERTGEYINKRLIESMIKGGAFDCFGMTRATLLANYEAIITDINNKKRRADSNQTDMFSILGDDNKEYQYEHVKELATQDKLLQEKEMLGMYVTGHPLAGYEKDFAAFNFNTSMLPKNSDDDDNEDEDDITIDDTLAIKDTDTQEHILSDNMKIETGGILTEVSFKRTKDGKEMAVCTLEDMYGRIEIIAFSRTLSSCKKFLVKDSLVRLNGRINMRDNEIKITLNSIKPWTLEIKEPEELVLDSRTLYLNLTNKSSDLLQPIAEILKAHSGPNIVKIQIDKQIFQHFNTINNLELVAKELVGILGAENIKII